MWLVAAPEPVAPLPKLHENWPETPAGSVADALNDTSWPTVAVVTLEFSVIAGAARSSVT